jgi:hypothetical protein
MDALESRGMDCPSAMGVQWTAMHLFETICSQLSPCNTINYGRATGLAYAMLPPLLKLQ